MIDGAIRKSDCSGCKMCGDLCPHNAIGFEVDHEGFWYPVVNADSCTECGICLGSCPVLNETENEMARSPVVYASWIHDEDIRIKSTSGGLYWALAETALKEGAYISGCIFSDDWKSAKHIVGNTHDDLKKIFRSKYIQSDTAGVYRKVRELLVSGEKVLFCGTPCHNAALLEFLGKDHERLILCDFICRGVNSPKAHEAHIEELVKRYKSEIEFFNFKNKKQGWNRLGLLVKFKNGKESFTNRYNSAWTRGYIGSNLYMRPSCENCRFKSIPRISDITLADFWGLKKGKNDIKKGISLAMTNTEKGHDFYKKTLPLLHSEPSALEQAVEGNACIYNTPKFNHEKRNEFFRRIENESFSDVVFELEGTNRFNIFFFEKVMIFKEIAIKWIKKILRMT